MSITQAEMLQAVHDAMIDLAKTRASTSAVAELSSGGVDAAKHFESGMIEIKDAYARFSDVIRRVFPE